MTALATDRSVDDVVIEPLDAPDSLSLTGPIQGPRELLALTSALQSLAWPNNLMYVAMGVRDHEGIGIDGTGFRYPADLDPWEERFDGVEVYSPLGDVYVSLPAFERLMARFLHAVIVGSTRTQAPVVRESWWPEFVAAVEQIEQRMVSQA